jgi:cobalt-zinc-cadmium efflux system membrane fusion protein
MTSRFDETYEVRMLTLGKRDDQWVEVIEGLKPGTEYVTGNSFLIKADIEKSGASHDH